MKYKALCYKGQIVAKVKKSLLKPVSYKYHVLH